MPAAIAWPRARRRTFAAHAPSTPHRDFGTTIVGEDWALELRLTA